MLGRLFLWMAISFNFQSLRPPGRLARIQTELRGDFFGTAGHTAATQTGLQWRICIVAHQLERNSRRVQNVALEPTSGRFCG